MGGNGTFAAGNIAKYRWETVGTVHGVKVLSLKNKGLSRKLPEEAHSSKMYIQQHQDGSFSQLRVYDSKHRLRFEIGYHREPSVDKSCQPVLHYHLYSPPTYKHGPAHPLTEAMKKKFGKYFTAKGVDKK